MAVNEDISAYSTTAASNTPAGSATVGPDLDNHLRDIKRNIRRATERFQGPTTPEAFRGREWMDTSGTGSNVIDLVVYDGANEVPYLEIDTSAGTARPIIDGTRGSILGKHSQFIPASAMRPAITNGCAPLVELETTAGNPDITYLAFDKDTEESAFFSFVFPKSWNKGTVTFSPYWTHTTGAAAFGVSWVLRAVAISDGDSIDATPAGRVSNDTGGTAETLYVGPESLDLTIVGSPANYDLIYFKIGRNAADANDTLDIDAWLLGIHLYYTIDALSDD